MATEEIADLVVLDAKLKKLKAEIKAAVTDRGTPTSWTSSGSGRPGGTDPGRRR